AEGAHRNGGDREVGRGGHAGGSRDEPRRDGRQAHGGAQRGGARGDRGDDAPARDLRGLGERAPRGGGAEGLAHADLSVTAARTSTTTSAPETIASSCVETITVAPDAASS